MSLFRQPITNQTGHLYVVDLARGLAAFAVMFWHYQHFYYLKPGVQPLTPALAATQPGYDFLWPLYDFGGCAVQFFWLLSGFVFAAVYVPKNLKARSFIVKRFARLYPLHLLTLCVVAVLQAVSLYVVGKFQIYEFNDAYHFALNLGFASFWGFQKGYSFNGPIWSISIEVLVYGFFWVTLPHLFRRGIIGPTIVTALAWALAFGISGHLHLLRECVFFFFAGTIVYLLFNDWRRRPALLFGIALVLAVAGSAVATERSDGIALAAYTTPLLALAVLFGVCGLEALSVGKHVRRAQWIGDSTYGTYLWHVPIQIVVLIYFSKYENARAAIHQPWFLVAFLFAVVATARLSFVMIEKPARKWLQRVAEPRSNLVNQRKQMPVVEGAIAEEKTVRHRS